MTELENGMLLYHASYAVINEIDLGKGRSGLDFGRGFYLTSSYEQASKYVPQTIKKAKRMGAIPNDYPTENGMINVFRFHPQDDLKVKYFANADVSWLHFVASNRDESLFPELIEQYAHVDIIAGKVADDYTARTLALYTDDAYGIPGEPETDEYTLKLLLPNKLQDQFCFKTEKAVHALEFVRVDRYGDE